MKFADKLKHEIRLAILQILAKDPGYSLNHEVLATALHHLRAHSLTDDQVKAELQWLADLGLVEIEQVDRFTIAKLTHLGKRAAVGRATIPGVARPDPADVE